MTQFITPTPVQAAPRKDIANIFFLLDKSGSMGRMTSQTIEGYNRFIADQSEKPGTTRVTLIQFNTERHVIYESIDIKEVPLLSTSSYMTGGGTALNDSIGYVLSEKMATCSPDETNIIAILTDGQELDSREYSPEAINALIADAQFKGWEVLFLGANMSKQEISAKYATLDASNVAVFDYSQKGVSDAFGALSATTTTYRGMKSMGNLSGRVDTQAVYAATAAASADPSVDISALFPKDQPTVGLAKAVAAVRGAIKDGSNKP